MKANVTHNSSVYIAKKLRLLRRMPAQPTSEDKTPNVEATVDRMSKVRFPTRMTSAFVQTLNQASRQMMRAARE